MNGRMWGSIGLSIIMFVASGCGSEEVVVEEMPNLLNYVDGGAITLNGKAVPNGTIINLVPKGGGDAEQKSSGQYQAGEGQYVISTLKGAEKFGGAPEGEYDITIHPSPRNPGSVPAKYASAATSGLTFTVKKGSNHIEPITLAP